MLTARQLLFPGPVDIARVIHQQQYAAAGGARIANPERMTDNTPAGDDAPRSFPDTPTGRPSGMAGKVLLRASSSDAVLAVVPHMLGFYPDRSLVVLGLGDRNRVRMTFRYDLPDPPDLELAADIADHAAYVLTREKIASAMLIGYGPAHLVNPVVARAADSLAAAGLQVHDALRADGGRFWSLFCDDPACCPPDGQRYDPGSHPAAAQMSAAGLTAHPDREALVRTLQPPAGSAEKVRRATNVARLRLAEMAAQSEAAGERDPQLRIARIGRAAMQRAIRRYRAGGSITGGHELAWLAVLLADLRVRDDAWARMDSARNDAHRRLWTDILKGASADYVPAPAALLAFTAWQSGNGALATVAVERALRADPGYSMALLLSSALEAGLPPSAAKMPMSPAQVAASYAMGGKDSQARDDLAAGSRGARSQGSRARSGRARSASPGSRRSSGVRSAGGRPGGAQQARAKASARRRTSGRWRG
jgi:hypothetical protein